MFLMPDRGTPEVQALQTICCECARKVAVPAAQRAWAKWNAIQKRIREQRAKERKAVA